MPEQVSLTQAMIQRMGRLAMTLALGLAGITPCAAEVFPAHPLRVVVPFPAGGTADVLPRIIGEKLATRWGQAVVVENRAGAAGNIGGDNATSTVEIQVAFRFAAGPF